MRVLNSRARQPSFDTATTDYLKVLEWKYEKRIAEYRAEQICLAKARKEARLRAAQNEDHSFLSFRQVIAMGLGGMMVATAHIPSADRLEIGSALFQDVLSGGSGNALQNVVKQKCASYLPSHIGGNAGSGIAAATSSPGSQTDNNASSMRYSFTRPSGTSGSVSISYRSDACLSAKKKMTKIYSCNMIDDFSKVASICSNACGSPQCSD